jgi:predicted thioesterase
MTSGVSVGALGSIRHGVGEDDTAIHMGSGDVPVLATPRVVAWLEAAAVAALANLPPDMTSVGIHIAVDHVAPTLVGTDVRSEATVSAVDGNRIDFEVKAFADDRLIAAGIHSRVLVDQKRFLRRAGVETE